MKIAKGQQLSENEVEILLKSNSGGVPWKNRPGGWATENGELVARYDSVEHMLMVARKDYLAREKANKAAKEGQNLEGF